ncbi:MAG: FapA family protein [Dehalococcoidia bacterium]|nr:FapA family protein [Dehalococcoidia bacterium]
MSGSVETATIESGGSIWIAKGVLGHNKTVIKVAKEIHLKFASNAAIIAGGDIFVHGEIVTCRVESGDDISVGTKEATRSRIVGGKLSAARSIQTVDLGSDGGAITVLSVAQKAIASFQRQERETAERLTALQQNQKTINAEVAKCMRMRSAGEIRLDQSGAPLLDRLTLAAGQIQEQILNIENQLAERKAEMAKLDHFKVVVNGNLFPGVQVEIGPWKRTLRYKLSRVQLIADRESASIVVVKL